MKTKVNLSLDEDTALRLRSLAQSSHKTMSQWVTDAVWDKAAELEREAERPNMVIEKEILYRVEEG